MSGFCIGRVAYLRLLVVVSLGAIGCDRTRPGDVSGIVRYNNKKLVYGSVVLVGGDGIPRTGGIGSDGTYSITNVPSGDVKVAVVCERPVAPGVKKPSAEGQPERPAPSAPPAPQSTPAGWFPIPKKYADVTTSGLTITISAGPNSQDLSLSD